ncbi:MAG: molybdenum cofactor guanylyltransferase [Planctomycetes bacterium]|nr:molybdenum cofactor guanylyltransferase [Planctomycetota bacterium]
MNAVILCGGKSSRMGRDKALIKINDRPVVSIIYDSLKVIFDEVALSVKTGTDEYHALGYRLIEDNLPGSSPLVGIYSALQELKGTHIFVIACDMPLIDIGFIAAMRNEISAGYDVIVPVTANGIEPLYGFYSKNCINEIKNRIDRGDHKIINFYPEVKTRQIDIRTGQWAGVDIKFSLNLNTPADMKKLERTILELNL